MLSGIFNLLTKGFGIDLANETPYHETLNISGCERLPTLKRL